MWALICYSDAINYELIGMDEFRKDDYNYHDLRSASVYDNFILQ